MKASELRIGNLIFINMIVCKCVSGNIKEIALEEIVPKNVNKWKPIPLTKEWLLKFGFKPYKGWDDMIFWCLPKDQDNVNRFELCEVTKGFETPNEKLCEYVHQLQNCYYFHELTGEELTLKTEL